MVSSLGSALLRRKSIISVFFRLFFFSFLLLHGSLYATERYGAIEIGGKGVKAYAINIDDGFAKIIHRDAKNIAPQSGIQKDGHMDKGMIALIATNALFLKNSLMLHQNIPEEKIFVVASSAINKVHNKQDLVKSIADATQSKLHFIDEKEESLYGFYGVVPKIQWENALMMDIGGGNTKVAWLTKVNSEIDFFEIPLGTVSLSKAAEATPGLESFEEKCKNIASNATIENQKLDLIKNIETLYVSGGIFWATAYLKTNRNIDTFEALKREDFENMRLSLMREDDIARYLQSSYGTKNIMAGSILAEKTIERLGFLDKKIYFAKDGTWIIGWLFFKNMP